MTKRLYIVRVEFEYAAIADSQREAMRFAEDALSDTGDLDACTADKVELASPTGEARPPDQWGDDSLVYGSDEDLTFEQAVAEYVDKGVK